MELSCSRFFDRLRYTKDKVNNRLHQNKQQSTQKNMRKHVLLAVIPHTANDFQPHLIRRYGLLAVLVLVVGVQLLYNFKQTGSVLGENANVSMDALLEGTNQERRKAGLANLNLNSKLNQAAYFKVNDMFEKQYWGHDAPDGTKPWKWFIEADYGYTMAGENLAKNFYTAESVTAAWMDSAEHRKNMLEPDYTEVGFAVANEELHGKNTTVVVALYGRPNGTGVVVPGTLIAGAQKGSLSLIERFGIGMQSISPVSLGSIIVLSFLIMVAFVAHLYRDYIPHAVNHPRHRYHHGAIKMGLMFGLIVAMVLLYGGGQI